MLKRGVSGVYILHADGVVVLWILHRNAKHDHSKGSPALSFAKNDEWLLSRLQHASPIA